MAAQHWHTVLVEVDKEAGGLTGATTMSAERYADMPTATDAIIERLLRPLEMFSDHELNDVRVSYLDDPSTPIALTVRGVGIREFYAVACSDGCGMTLRVFRSGFAARVKEQTGLSVTMAEPGSTS